MLNSIATAAGVVVAVLAVVAVATAAFLLARRTRPTTSDAPVVELATVPADRSWWIRSRLHEKIGPGKAPVATLESLTLADEVPTVPVTTALPRDAHGVRTPLAMPLAQTGTAAHSPFAQAAVRADGRIALPDDDSEPEIVWHTAKAAPTSFTDPAVAAATTDPSPASDAPILLGRQTPDEITWAPDSD